jgi:hypothetical protein
MAEAKVHVMYTRAAGANVNIKQDEKGLISKIDNTKQLFSDVTACAEYVIILCVHQAAVCVLALYFASVYCRLQQPVCICYTLL